jgi:signal transduction histidine kinase
MVTARPRTFMRFATGGILAYCTVFPIVQVAVIAESAGGGYRRAAWALAATACFLPLHLRHVLHAVRGTRPAHAVSSFVIMSAIIVGVTPLAGPIWLPTYHAIAVSALIVLRPRWSLPVVAAVVVAQAPLAMALDSAIITPGAYYTLTVIWRSSAVFVPVWLLGTIRQLDTARQALARDAVVRERLDIDAELRRTLGIALAGIAARGESASSRVDRDPATVDGELQDLVDSSRRTLAEARQLIRGYHRPSLRAELLTATALLGAAGIETRLVLPSGELDAGPDVRAEIRAATSALLRDGTARSCVITVTGRDGGPHLDVSTLAGRPA